MNRAIGNESMIAAFFSAIQSYCYNQHFGEPVTRLSSENYEAHFFTRDVAILPGQPVRNDDLENRIYMAVFGETRAMSWEVPVRAIYNIIEEVWLDYLRYHWQIVQPPMRVQSFSELDEDLKRLMGQLNTLIETCAVRLPPLV